ncbi:MFS transporter [Facklamia hominis]|uniref:MFS transporter n=1 Tax=Facklamia hominis TaxID=178214 RepID=A0AAJ1Q2Q6_9LACT|nr:MFS transporter [Facklamia hominis]MDK7186653.1 MFS transporter [Facklamia hominis]
MGRGRVVIKSSIRLKESAFVASYGAMFFEGALNVIINASLIQLAQSLDRSLGEVAQLISAKSLGTLLFLYLAGKWSDQYGRKPLVLLGSLCFLIFLLGFSWTTSFTGLLLLALLGGVGHGLMDAPSMSILFDLLADKAGSALILVQFFFSLGGMFVSFVVSHTVAAGLSYRWIYALMLGFGLVYFLHVALSPLPALRRSEGSAPLPQKASQILATPAMMTVLAGICLFAIYQYIMLTWTPHFLQQTKGYQAATALRTVAIYQMGGALGSVAFSLVLRRIRAAQLALMNTGLTLGLSLALLFLQQALTLQLCLFLMGAIMSVYFSLCISIGGELYPQATGLVSGAIASFNVVTTLLASLLISFLMEGKMPVTALFLLLVLILGILMGVSWKMGQIEQGLKDSIPS